MRAREFDHSRLRNRLRDIERLERRRISQVQGHGRSPPVIMLQHANGLELMEGWHRIMDAFRLHPKGFRINAWIGVAA